MVLFYRSLFFLFVGLTVGSIISLLWWYLDLLPSAPRIPDAVHRISYYSFNSVSTVVYLTPLQYFARRGLIMAAGGSVAGAAWAHKHCRFNYDKYYAIDRSDTW